MFKLKNRPKKIDLFLWSGISSVVFILLFMMYIFISYFLKIFPTFELVIWVPCVMCQVGLAICSFISYFYSNTGTITFSMASLTFLCESMLTFENFSGFDNQKQIAYIIAFIFSMIPVCCACEGKYVWSKELARLLEKG